MSIPTGHTVTVCELIVSPTTVVEVSLRSGWSHSVTCDTDNSKHLIQKTHLMSSHTSGP